MPDRLSMHAPVLVNTLGHCAGATVFGILLYFLLTDWRRDPGERSALPTIAAGLAFLWNIGSLVGVATAPGEIFADIIVAASFSVLSLLPAVLLHISLGTRWTPLSIAGYVVSTLAVALHIVDLITEAARFHYAAILLITVGFGVLTAIALVQEVARGRDDGSGRRLAGSMVLFLLAISFVHFRADHDAAGWSGELALHHAGIPLALFVILQDYRFLLVDAFIRFLVNAGLAALTVCVGLAMHVRFAAIPLANENKVFVGLEFVAATLLLSLFAVARTQAQRALTKVVFLRAGAEQSLATLNVVAAGLNSESEFLKAASDTIAKIVSARRVEVCAVPPAGWEDLRQVTPVSDAVKQGCPLWTQVVAPLRLSRGDIYFLYLGSRSGGRRYLSEDIELLDRMIAMICERIERMRNSEMQNLVIQAELRALQAQINPHFFFNALNTLYGTIPRESVSARRLVVNLADLFRVSFASERTTIRIEEEIRIVRAYLQIEQLRLGSRLLTAIDVDDAALQTEVPVLSIQPLVENAVKHGVAARTGGGLVRLAIRADETSVSVTVSNTGSFGNDSGGPESGENGGTGVGLTNVRRRLVLCYGQAACLNIMSEDDMTTVSFSVPISRDVLVREQTIVRRHDHWPAPPTPAS